MNKNEQKHLLLLAPTTTYRAGAFVEAAGRLPARVCVASETPSALSGIARGGLPTFDFSDTDSAGRFAREFGGRHAIDAVVGVDDRATIAAAAIAETLGLPGNPVSAVRAALDKSLCRRAIKATGVAQPRFALIEAGSGRRAASPLPFPVVVKPTSASGSLGVIRADTPDAFASAVARTAHVARSAGPGNPDAADRVPVLVEEFIPGWEVAVEGILSGGRFDLLAVFDKPEPLDGPFFPETIYTTPSRLPAVLLRRVISTVRTAIKALGLRHGPVHVELRGDTSNVYLIEIAPRSIGGRCSRALRFGAGATLEDVILRHALELDPEAPPRMPGASGVAMLYAPNAGRLVSIDGVAEALTVPGVTAVDVTTHEGAAVSLLPDDATYLGFVFASAETAGDVETILRNARDHIAFEIDSPGAVGQISAGQN